MLVLRKTSTFRQQLSYAFLFTFVSLLFCFQNSPKFAKIKSAVFSRKNLNISYPFAVTENCRFIEMFPVQVNSFVQFNPKSKNYLNKLQVIFIMNVFLYTKFFCKQGNL